MTAPASPPASAERVGAVRAYYNEVDPYAAEWLRNLIAAGLITPGHVDTRSIVDVRPSDLDGFDRCHFFAGIAGWERALDLAGWGAAPVWTGSCPCQPFSSAARGRATGFGSGKDLWPSWFWLIRERKPPKIFGEQVTGARSWLDRVCDDLEGLGYTCRASILTSLGVGADHLRPRIYFEGYSDSYGQPELRLDAEAPRMPRPDRQSGRVVPAHGIPSRVAVLSAFGNAIDPRVAASFIAAARDSLPRKATAGLSASPTGA